MAASDSPKLRYLEAVPHSHEGKPVIILRDPTGIGAENILVPPETYYAISLFNGENSILDIQAELTRRTGRLIFREDIERLVELLDEAFYLENENFLRHQNEIVEAFRSEKTRIASHAGSSYPNNPAELLDLLSSFYSETKGAGLTGGVGTSSLNGLIAPHIDLRLGGTAYSHAYRCLAESPKADLFVILGTGHLGLPNLFSVSAKRFQTPLGTTEVDSEFIDLLMQGPAEEFFQEQLVHRTEHTIEFQLLFLQHLFANQELKVVPVLTSFSYLDVDPLNDSNRVDLFESFVETMQEAALKSGKSICYIASADLAHIGPRYGDSFNPDASVVESVMSKDREMLMKVCNSDADDFLDYVKAEQDSRRVCGFPCIYTLLRLLPEAAGRLLVHDYSNIDATGSFVTYASLSFSDTN